MSPVVAPPSRPPRPAYPPPAGPRLEPGPAAGVAGPDHPAPAGAPRTVDWWAWQARVRTAAGPLGARPRTAAPRRTPVVVAVVVAVAGVLAAGGAVAVAGRRGAAAPARLGSGGPAPERAALAVPAPVATPLELVGVSDLPPSPPPAPPEPPPPPAPVVLPVGTRFPVARLAVDLVDGSRPTVARGAAATAPGRLLRTEVRLPDAPDAGPFPVIVFAHGYATSTGAYAGLLDELAAAGYVVVAPELPGTSTALGPQVGGREPAAQVDDVAFVITEVEALAGPEGPLAGRVRPGPVVVMGHSDGGMTAAAAAFSGARRDPRVGAAVVLSGARLDDGSAWFGAGGPALLAVHGDADTVNPFAASQQLYAANRSGSPRYLVRVVGGGHTDAFVGSRTRSLLVTLVDDFVRAALGTDPDAAARVPAAASAPGVLELVGS